MKFLKFEAENIFSLGKIEIDLADRGLTLITGYSKDENGSNGAGKSSISSKGILWTLFGRTPSGIRADAVKRFNSKGLTKYGRVTFSNTSHIYTVYRQRSPNKLIVTVDDKEIQYRNANEAQTQINSIMGCNFDTFLQTTYFGQGKSKNYISFSPAERKELLSHFLPMEEIRNWQDMADSNFKVVNTKSKDIKNELEKRKYALKLLKTKLTEAKFKFSEVEAETTKKLKAIDTNEIFIDLKKSLQARKEYFSIIDNVDYDTELNNVVNELKKIDDCLDRINNLKPEPEPSSLHYVRSTTSDYKKALTNTNCKECEAPIPKDKMKKQIEQAYSKMVHEVKKYIEYKTHKHLQFKLITDKKFLTSREAAFNVLVEEKREKAALIRSTEDKISIYNEMQQNMRTSLLEKLDTERAKKDSLKEDIDNLDKECVKYIEKEEMLQKHEVALSYWKSVFNEKLLIKLYEAMCPFLNDRINYHLQKLNIQHITIKFNTVEHLSSGLKERFTQEILLKDHEIDIDQLSGGEQQMVNLAIGLTLADLAETKTNPIPFMILDEPFHDLDQKNSQAIVNYLTGEYKKSKNTILLISNDEALKELVPNRIHVVKEYGVTAIA